MDYQKIRNKRHYVYDDIDEFRAHNPNTEVKKDWKTANEGDWVYTDDGRIVQLLKVSSNIKHHNDRKNYKYADGWVRTIVGTFIINKTSTMDSDFTKHPNRYTFSGTKPQSTKERKNITNKEKMFATNVAVGMGIVKSYMDAFDSDDTIKSKKKAVMLIKQDRVMREIEKSVMDIAKNMGLDHEYVLGKLKLLADNSEDDNIVLQSAKEIGKIIGTTGNTVKQKELGMIGMFQGFSPQQLEEAKRPLLEAREEE